MFSRLDRSSSASDEGAKDSCPIKRRPTVEKLVNEVSEELGVAPDTRELPAQTKDPGTFAERVRRAIRKRM